MAARSLVAGSLDGGADGGSAAARSGAGASVGTATTNSASRCSPSLEDDERPASVPKTVSGLDSGPMVLAALDDPGWLAVVGGRRADLVDPALVIVYVPSPPAL